MSKRIAWAVLIGTALLVVGLYATTYASWYALDGMDFGKRDIPFWPGGLAIMLLVPVALALVMVTLWGIFSGLCRAVEVVRGY